MNNNADQQGMRIIGKIDNGWQKEKDWRRVERE
jgi:hypothetical protein